MMISWNIRGINKRARCNEIDAYTKNKKVSCIALIETRVKMNNAASFKLCQGSIEVILHDCLYLTHKTQRRTP